jgi:hypothetical protein
MWEPKTITKFIISKGTKLIMHQEAHSAVLLECVKGAFEACEELDGEVALGLHVERSEDRHPDIVGHPVEVPSHPKTGEGGIVSPPRRGELARRDSRIHGVVGGPET